MRYLFKKVNAEDTKIVFMTVDTNPLFYLHLFETTVDDCGFRF